MNHYLYKTACLLAATLIVGGVCSGKLRSGSADEPAPSNRETRPAAPQRSLNRQPEKSLGGIRIMRRLPPVLKPAGGQPHVSQFNEALDAAGARSDLSRDGLRLPERGSVVNWNQDPADHSKTVRLLATQYDLRGDTFGAGRSDDPAGELPNPANTGTVTLHLKEVNVRQALEMLSRSHGLSILVAPGVAGMVTANLEGLQVDQALDAIVKLANLVAHREGDLIYVYSATEFPQANFRVHVFPLDYVSAVDVLPVISNLLTPTGQVTASSVDPTDNTKAREAVVVTDRPEILERVADFLRQVDIAPLQVMIEAHVLQVELGDDLKHGVNLKHAIDMVGSSGVELELSGFADEAESPALFARIAGKKIDGLLQFLKTTKDAKTLASPRVMVINGQKARIQVGEQIPYEVVTASENFSVNDIRFLSVGVVLEVTPRISQDGRVMLRVKPKVSSGTFNSETKLPGEATREIETDVLLEDGLGLVIGGLIQEEDTNLQSKIPYLGDLHYVGRLFQKRELKKKRSEIVITLVPRILYSSEGITARDMVDAERSQTPLLMGPLCRFPRPWEPQLPDAVNNPEKLHMLRHRGCRGCDSQPCDCEYNQSWDGANKELNPTPVGPAPASPQQLAFPPVETQTTSPRQGPPPVYFQPVFSDETVAPSIFTESHPPVPRILP